MGKIHNVEKMTDNRFVNLYHVDATSVHNTPVSYFVASRARDTDSMKIITRKNKPDGVIIYSIYGEKNDRVVLIRQFRVATWVNGNESGQLIESCAGLLDNDEPEVCIRKEAIEETGYEVGEVRKLFELYMSPGGVTELIHFFIAEYSDNQRANAGGGVEDEDIEVLELPFSQALEMIKTGEIRDGKTVLLLNYLQTSHLMD